MIEKDDPGSTVALACLLLVIGLLVPTTAQGITVETCEPGTFQDRASEEWSLTTLPVGHGDAHVLTSPGGEVMVVDAGSTETVDTLITWLEERSIHRIDRIVVTHPHWDHIGGVAKLVDRFEVQRLLRPGLSHSTTVTRRVERTLKTAGVPVRHPSRGETFPIGSGKLATVIHPGKKRNGGLNQNSLAFYLEVGTTRLLMMGDVHGSAEDNLLEKELVPEADLLKVAHHGNAEGTTRQLLRTVDPSIAVLPAPLRKNDPWGKPDPGLVERLQTFGIPTFQTGKVGRIKVTFDEKAIRTVRIDSGKACPRNDV